MEIIQFSTRTQMLTVNVKINVMIIGQPPVTAIFLGRARLAYKSTFTVMDPISGTTLIFKDSSELLNRLEMKTEDSSDFPNDT